VTRDDLHTIYLAFAINGKCHHDRAFDVKVIDRTGEIDGFSFLQEGFHLVRR